MNLQELLTADTLEEIDQNLSLASDLATQKKKKLTDLNSKRKSILLADNDAEITAFEQDLTLTQRHISQLELTTAELIERRAQVEKTLFLEEAKAACEVAKKEYAKGVSLLDKYQKSAASIIKIIEELDAIYLSLKKGEEKYKGLEVDWPDLPEFKYFEPPYHEPDRRETVEKPLPYTGVERTHKLIPGAFHHGNRAWSFEYFKEALSLPDFQHTDRWLWKDGRKL